MVTDEIPRVDHNDDYIKEWAINHRMRKYPVERIFLSGAIYEECPDVAIIYWDTPGQPVNRSKVKIW